MCPDVHLWLSEQMSVLRLVESEKRERSGTGTVELLDSLGVDTWAASLDLACFCVGLDFWGPWAPQHSNQLAGREGGGRASAHSGS